MLGKILFFLVIIASHSRLLLVRHSLPSDDTQDVHCFIDCYVDSHKGGEFLPSNMSILNPKPMVM